MQAVPCELLMFKTFTEIPKEEQWLQIFCISVGILQTTSILPVVDSPLNISHNSPVQALSATGKLIFVHNAPIEPYIQRSEP